MPSFSTSVSVMNPATEMVAGLLGCLTAVRTFHWASSSYSEHQALGELYESISELLDTFVEQFQGRYGRFDRTRLNQAPISSESDALSYLRDAREFIDEKRSEQDFTAETSLQNVIDEIVGEIDRTIYKVGTLK